MQIKDLEPGIICFDKKNKTLVKMNPEQRYLNKPMRGYYWMLKVRTGGFTQMCGDIIVTIML